MHKAKCSQITALAAGICLQSHCWADKCEIISTVMVLAVSWCPVWGKCFTGTTACFWPPGEKPVCLLLCQSTRTNPTQNKCSVWWSVGNAASLLRHGALLESAFPSYHIKSCSPFLWLKCPRNALTKILRPNSFASFAQMTQGLENLTAGIKA